MLIFKQCQTILLLLPHLLSGSVPSLKDKNTLFSFFLFKITKSRRLPRLASVLSSLTSSERRDERHSGILLSSPSPTVSHPLLSPPPSVCEDRCSQLSSILFSSPSGLSSSLSLSLSLMLALIAPALLPPPSLTPSLSLLAASVIYAFMRVCMHAQAAERLSLQCTQLE